jgi:hypothetical protein
MNAKEWASPLMWATVVIVGTAATSAAILYDQASRESRENQPKVLISGPASFDLAVQRR